MVVLRATLLGLLHVLRIAQLLAGGGCCRSRCFVIVLAQKRDRLASEIALAILTYRYPRVFAEPRLLTIYFWLKYRPCHFYFF